MCADRTIWWVFTRLSRCCYQPLCAMCGRNLAGLTLPYIVQPCVADVANVDCALCRQLNKRTLLLYGGIAPGPHKANHPQNHILFLTAEGRDTAIFTMALRHQCQGADVKEHSQWQCTAMDSWAWTCDGVSDTMFNRETRRGSTELYLSSLFSLTTHNTTTLTFTVCHTANSKVSK